ASARDARLLPVAGMDDLVFDAGDGAIAGVEQAGEVRRAALVVVDHADGAVAEHEEHAAGEGTAEAVAPFAEAGFRRRVRRNGAREFGVLEQPGITSRRSRDAGVVHRG